MAIPFSPNNIILDDTECNCNPNPGEYHTCEKHDLSNKIPIFGTLIRFDMDRADSWYGICVSLSTDTEFKVIEPQIMINNGKISLGLDTNDDNYADLTDKNDFFEKRSACGCGAGYLNDGMCNNCEKRKTDWAKQAFRQVDGLHCYEVISGIGSYTYPVMQKRVDNLFFV